MSRIWRQAYTSSAYNNFPLSLSLSLQMKRQRSIHSFFQKPSPAECNADTGNILDARQVPWKHRNDNSSRSIQPPSGCLMDSSLEVRGTDTPPEKVPRQVFPESFTMGENSGGSSLFSSILHKFVKVDVAEQLPDRNQAHDYSTDGLPKKEVPALRPDKDKKCISNSLSDHESLIKHEAKDDVVGPDTPGTRPLVPRLKRVQEDAHQSADKTDSCSPITSKRVKLLQDSRSLSNNHSEINDSTSKFEWLDPSRIRDANGRRPNDPLYDKRTLYIPPDALKKMSASQKQYWSCKSQYMDVVLFFKVGTFYELYELDAELGHKELDWKMTSSGVGRCRQVGISQSGIDDAVEKLVARGYKVGRMEQLETSDQAKARGGKSVVSRKLIQVVTPSTTMDGNIGPDAVHLLSLKEGQNGPDDNGTVYGFAFVDCAAVRFWVGYICDDASCASLGTLLMQVAPREILYETKGLSKETHKAIRKYSLSGSTVQLTPVTSFVDASEVKNLVRLKGYFQRSYNSWSNVLENIEHQAVTLCALGGLIGHLSRLMLDDILSGGDILPYKIYEGCLRMEGQTMVNLEIFNNNADGGLRGTLYKYLDSCMTSSGKRLLRRWICHPLKSVEGINDRLNVVEQLRSHAEVMLVITQYLGKIPDIERMFGQIRANYQASASLVLPLIGKKLLKRRVRIFGSLVKGLRIGMDLLLSLQNEWEVISSLSKIFKLPELNSSSGLDKFLSELEAAMDSEFPTYQNHEVTDSEAETLSVLIELFIEKATEWCEVIHAISCIDVLRSFAVIATLSCGSMCRPVILPESKITASKQNAGGPVIKIKGLWHPFALREHGVTPVPNDLFLGEDVDGYHPRTLLLTGPNMGGKSTLLRATCLAVILAQLGCFVPGENCVLSLVDIIFTRLGATDRIMTGESTFLVECAETASVLQNATQDSLVLLDELGRGTSTFDGYAIAYAVFRHLVEKVNCRLLFATHYHPLTKEFSSHPHVTLQHMACAFKPNSEQLRGDQDLVFLYRLNSGACPESYGLQVAKMAGIPEQVVEGASMAGQLMKKSLGRSFKSSEHRSEFSTLHEEWLKTLLNVSRIEDSNLEDDVYDTIFCLWYEMKNSYR
ncbi:hypothetical protein K2173_013244 [Erythroxylum novogranatense]|uniref:DNA mismatch repair protein n=1 Tax=Erythroxylum novogranatense TaxID=1862640 RepID=A0AAV8SC97_9ROSI|nr:hypothetical protein K2173_013244 [Erythroxylum novogranatense]